MRNKESLMDAQQSKQHFFSIERPAAFFILFWFVLNVVQVSLMELTSDEGYYWFYSQHLQWGYYDHPPLIALMIKAGTVLFPGELGVRFFNVILSTAGLYLFFLLLPAELTKTKRTYLVLLSAPLLHYLTFLVFPDGPLLFFTLLFLVAYKRFLQKQVLSSALLLGVALAFMAYSKYHGALVLLFTLLANPRLFRSAYFYAALLVATILFAPHLWWQYKNDFPTLKYHLSGRTGTISFRHVGEFISQQLFAIGPGLIFIPFIIRAKDIFERTLRFIIIGTFIFFLISSFKTFVHFHWTSIALYPLLYFAVKYYHQPQRKKLFNSLVIPFVILFAAARIMLAVPIIPNMHVGEDYYHGRKKWAKEIATIAKDQPVFMPNNLRETSLYSFYSGKLGVTLYNRPEKKSQYELWGYEDSLQNKNVLFVSKYPFQNAARLQNFLQQHLHYASIPSFKSFYTGIAINVAFLSATSDSVEAQIEIINNRSTPLEFSTNGETSSIVLSFEQNKKIMQSFVLLNLTSADAVAPKSSMKRKGKISVKELSQGRYDVFAGIRHGLIPDAILSAEKQINIQQ